MFNESKYTKIYYNIINKRRYNLIQDGEIHHIIPRSMGGSDDADNLIKLTYREHFICHLLLTKMCLNLQDQIKMCWAIHRLTFSKTNYNSHQYEIARKIHVKNLKDNHHSKRIYGWNERMIEQSLQSWASDEERRKNTSDRMKQNWVDNKEKLLNHNRKNSIKGILAYREKNKNKIEYKGNYYYSWPHLQKETNITKHLYKKYYINGIDPEFRIGTDGPIPSEKGESVR